MSVWRASLYDIISCLFLHLDFMNIMSLTLITDAQPNLPLAAVLIPDSLCAFTVDVAAVNINALWTEECQHSFIPSTG